MRCEGGMLALTDTQRGAGVSVWGRTSDSVVATMMQTPFHEKIRIGKTNGIFAPPSPSARLCRRPPRAGGHGGVPNTQRLRGAARRGLDRRLRIA
jgi:hypothetical protein